MRFTNGCVPAWRRVSCGFLTGGDEGTFAAVQLDVPGNLFLVRSRSGGCWNSRVSGRVKAVPPPVNGTEAGDHAAGVRRHGFLKGRPGMLDDGRDVVGAFAPVAGAA
jgi:hypothetical protein